MIGTILNGKYRVLRELGRGAMGVVYEGQHLVLGSRVAVKMLAPEFAGDARLRERFFKEASIQAGFNHPNVNSVLDYFEQDRHLFLVLAFVEGVPLAALLQIGIPMPEARARAIMLGVLAGLDYVHRQSVIHRDVKPSNIIVADGDRAVLIDFGIAMRAGGTRLTRSGGRVGTTHYMSPEQITRPMQIDHRTDVYSAGVVLYEAVTGGVPFDGPSDFDIEQMHVKSEPVEPRRRNASLSPGLSNAILRAMRKDPAERFQGCAEFHAALDEKRLGDGRGTRPALLAAAWTLALVMLGLGGWIALRDDLSALVNGNKTTVIWSPPSEDIETVNALVLSSIQSARMFCQAVEERPKKVKGEQLARRMSDSNVADLYDAQARELENTMAKGADEFARLVAALRQRDSKPVGQALDMREQAASAGEGAYIELLRGRALSGSGGGGIAAEDCPGFASR